MIREALMLATYVGLQAVSACALAPVPMTHYTVTLDVYVRDEQALCKQAWQTALEHFGPGVAETVTMIGGKYNARRCLETVVQTAPMGDEIVRAGMDVREVTP